MMRRRNYTIIALGVVSVMLITTRALASTTVDSPGSLFSIFGPTFGGSVRNAIPSPQSISHEGMTLTMVDAIVSASQTVVEFTIEDESFPKELEEMYRYTLGPGLIPGQDLHLTGFTSEDVYDISIRRETGKIDFVLELPPALSFDSLLVIEMDALPLNIKDEAGFRLMSKVEGPWRFEFKPKTVPGQRIGRRSKVGLSKMIGSAVVTLEEVNTSSTETVVTFNINQFDGGSLMNLGGAKIDMDGISYDGREKGNARLDSKILLSFPPIYSSNSDITVILGPFVVINNTPVNFELDVTEVQRGGMTATVGGTEIRFEAVQVPGYGYAIRYRPESNESRIILDGAGYPVIAIDDKGNSYTFVPIQLDFTRDYSVAAMILGSLEPLADDIETLDFTINKVSSITETIQFQLLTP